MDEMKTEILNYLQNICDKERLTGNLIFAGVFIAYFERIQHSAYKRLVGWYSDTSERDLGEPAKESRLFKEEVLNNDKNFRNKFNHVFDWFVSSNAITALDFDLFRKARKLRNELAHSLDSFLIVGPSKEDSDLFANLIRIYTTLDQWWINEMEMSFYYDHFPQDYVREDVSSVESIVLQIIREVATNQESFDYQESLNTIKNNISDKK